MTGSSAPKDAGFFRFWTATGISLFGSQVTTVALPLTAIAGLGASPMEVAMLAASGTAPFLLLGLPAGAWVDHWSRRRIMIWTDAARFILLVSIPVAFLAGALSMPQLYATSFLIGCATVFFDIAALSALPALVPPVRLTIANSRLEATRAVAHTTGPAAAGVFVQFLSAPLALVVDALSYLASALLIIRLPELPSPSFPGRRPGTLRQIKDGLRYCMSDPFIRALALAGAWINFWTEAVFAVLIVYAATQLAQPPLVIGAVLAASAAGYLLGSILAPVFTARVGAGPAIVVGVALQIGLALPSLATIGWPAAWLATGLAIHSIGIGFWNVNAVTLRQAITPEHLLSRMNATNRFLLWGAMPLGAAFGGLLASTAGPQMAVIVAGVAAPLCAVPLAASALGKLKQIPLTPGLDSADAEESETVR